jgi:DNA topoisomerase I
MTQHRYPGLRDPCRFGRKISGHTCGVMVRLRRVSCEGPGLRRRRRGRGFTYLDSDGAPIIEEETLGRIRGLVIPPAWTDVWISPDPLGHLQATGTDVAGRRQYRYHDRWRERRDAQKFDRMLGFARTLPELRARVASDLELEGLPREKALAAAVRLLDLASFRVGSESYARQNGSFGLATLRRDHVRLSGKAVLFDYVAKSGTRRVQEVSDPCLLPVLRRLKRRRDPHAELLAYRNGSGWRDIRSADVNDYLKHLAGEDVSAKDFRTWHATVLAAVTLAMGEQHPDSAKGRRRRIREAVNEVAGYLGNTPAVARASYIDPRLIERYEEGRTIRDTLDRLGIDDLTDRRVRDAVEGAVLELLDEEREALAAA